MGIDVFIWALLVRYRQWTNSRPAHTSLLSSHAVFFLFLFHFGCVASDEVTGRIRQLTIQVQVSNETVS